MPVGKPEVVLDPRARSRLTAGGVRLDHEHVEPLRRPVDCRRQAGRAGADDHHVAHVRLIDGVVEAEALGDPAVARVAQHGIAAADEDRDVGLGHVEAIEHLLGVGVAIEIDVGERVAVAREEFLHPQRAGAVRRAEHDNVAEAVGDQLDAPEDEGAHEDLAQLGVGLNEGE